MLAEMDLLFFYTLSLPAMQRTCQAVRQVGKGGNGGGLDLKKRTQIKRRTERER